MAQDPDLDPALADDLSEALDLTLSAALEVDEALADLKEIEERRATERGRTPRVAARAGGAVTRKSATAGRGCTGPDCPCDSCRAAELRDVMTWLPEMGTYGIYECDPETGRCTFRPRMG